MVKYSIIVPVFNEEVSSVLLCKKIKEVMDGIKSGDYEIILIDDGSTDNTASNLKATVPLIPELKVLILSKNYGQSAAFQAGLDISAGEIIISMDGDLQNDPEDIPNLLSAMQEGGFDVICGWMKDKHDKLSKRMASFFANLFRKLLFKEKIHDVGCMFRVYKKEILLNLNLDGCKHRFLTSILSKKGANIGEVEVKSRPRLYGASKYGIIDRFLKSIIEMFRLKLFKQNTVKPYIVKEIITHSG